jgi:hypothetical protein
MTLAGLGRGDDVTGGHRDIFRGLKDALIRIDGGVKTPWVRTR